MRFFFSFTSGANFRYHINFFADVDFKFEIHNPQSKIEIPPTRLERVTHSLAYLTWFPKPQFSEEKG